MLKPPKVFVLAVYVATPYGFEVNDNCVLAMNKLFVVRGLVALDK